MIDTIGFIIIYLKIISQLHPTNENEHHSTNIANPKSGQHLSKAMLTQNNATCPQHSRQQQQHTEWPNRIIKEQDTESIGSGYNRMVNQGNPQK
jgi:hypothetical protein